jgi:hypothetical protein
VDGLQFDKRPQEHSGSERDIIATVYLGVGFLRDERLDPPDENFRGKAVIEPGDEAMMTGDLRDPERDVALEIAQGPHPVDEIRSLLDTGAIDEIDMHARDLPDAATRKTSMTRNRRPFNECAEFAVLTAKVDCIDRLTTGGPCGQDLCS